MPRLIGGKLDLDAGIGVPFGGDEHRFGHGGSIADGTVEVQGRRAGDGLGDDPHLDAELSAREGLLVAHLLATQRFLELVEMEMDVDAPADNNQLAILPFALEVGRRDLRLQGRLVVGLGAEFAFINRFRLLQGCLGVALDDRLRAADVVRRMRVDHVSPGSQGFRRGHLDRQGIVFHLHRRRGRPGLLPRFGGDRDDRVAQNPDLVFTQDRLVRVDLTETVRPLDILGPYRMPTTPGIFSAAEVSMDLMMPWAMVLRTTANLQRIRRQSGCRR